MAQTKTITTYKVSAFDSKAAAEGGLCVMVANTYTLPPDGVIDITEASNSNTIKGTGICKCVNPDKFLFTVDSIVYTFNSEGKAANLNSVGMKLLMGEITETLSTAGPRVTKGFGENAPSYDITSLSARDEFAIQALRGLLRTIEDPASLSDTEKRYYCDVAYQWAANMMQSAAYTRQNAVNPADVSVPDVEGIVGALGAVSTAINGISISGGSGGSTDVSGIVNKLEDIDFADEASLNVNTNTTPLVDAILMAPYWKEINSIASNTDGEIIFTIDSTLYEGKTLRIVVYDSNSNIITPNNSYKWKVDYYRENRTRFDYPFNTTDYIEFDNMSNLLSMSLDTQPYYFSDGDFMVATLVTEVSGEYVDIAVDRVRIFQSVESTNSDSTVSVDLNDVVSNNKLQVNVSGAVNIGSSGRGSSSSNPFYVSFNGDYLPLTGGTLTGNLRLKDSTNYGMKLLFGDGENCYLYEDTDDHLHIYASNGITLEGDGITLKGVGIVIDAEGSSVNINDDVYLKPGTKIYLQEVVNNITREREVATQKWVGDNYASINSVITKTNNSTSLLKANGDTIALTNFMQGDRIKELCEMLNRCFEQANVDIVVGYKKPTQDTFALLPAASAGGIHRIGTGVTYVTTNTAAAYIGYVEGSFGSGSAGITNPLIIIISGVIKLLGTSADGSSLYYFNQGNIQTTNSDWNMSSFVNSILSSAVTKLSKIGIDVQNGNSTLVLGSGMSSATVSYYIPDFL